MAAGEVVEQFNLACGRTTQALRDPKPHSFIRAGLALVHDGRDRFDTADEYDRRFPESLADRSSIMAVAGIQGLRIEDKCPGRQAHHNQQRTNDSHDVLETAIDVIGPRGRRNAKYLHDVVQASFPILPY